MKAPANDWVEREVLCEYGGFVIQLHSNGVVLIGSVGRPWGMSQQAQLSQSDLRKLASVLGELQRELT